MLLRLCKSNAFYCTQIMDGLHELHGPHVDLRLVDGLLDVRKDTCDNELFLLVHDLRQGRILPPGHMALHRMRSPRNLNATFFVAPTFGFGSAACIVTEDGRAHNSVFARCIRNSSYGSRCSRLASNVHNTHAASFDHMRHHSSHNLTVARKKHTEWASSCGVSNKSSHP
jgi:hypothetical protein